MPVDWSEFEATDAPDIVSAAYKDDDGTIHTGANHPEIVDRLGLQGFDDRDSRNIPSFGYVTDEGAFITRPQAAVIAKQNGQQLEPFETPGQPHSNEIESPTQPGKALGDVPQKPKTKIDWSQFAPTSPDVLKQKGLIDDKGMPRFQSSADVVEDPADRGKTAEQIGRELSPTAMLDQPAAPIGSWVLKAARAAEGATGIAPDQTLTRFFPQIQKWKEGLEEAEAEGIDSLTTPKNLALLGVGGGTAMLGKEMAAAVSGFFTWLMAKDLPDTYKQIKEEWKKPEGERDEKKLAKLIGSGAQQLGLAGLTGAHAVAGFAPPGVPPVIPTPEAPAVPPPAPRGPAATPPVLPPGYTGLRVPMRLRTAAEREGTPEVTVPETPPEPEREINVLEEIRQSGARTTKQVQDLFPKRGLSNEEAAELRRQAWGEVKPGQKKTELERFDTFSQFIFGKWYDDLTPEQKNAVAKGFKSPTEKPTPTTESEEPNAIQKPEAEKLLPDVQPQPGESKQPLPAKEGDQGVRVSGEEKGPETREVLLTPQEGMSKLEGMSLQEMSALNQGGSTATGWAFKIGMQVKDQAGLDALIEASKKFTDQARETKIKMQAEKDPAKKMDLIQEFGNLGIKRQLANEAYEAATGMTMPEPGKPSTPKDVSDFAKKIDPNYKPPMAPKVEAPAAPKAPEAPKAPAAPVPKPEERPEGLPPLASKSLWMGRPVSDWRLLQSVVRLKNLSPENLKQLAVHLNFKWDPAKPQFGKLADALKARLDAAEKPRKPKAAPKTEEFGELPEFTERPELNQPPYAFTEEERNKYRALSHTLRDVQARLNKLPKLKKPLKEVVELEKQKAEIDRQMINLRAQPGNRFARSRPGSSHQFNVDRAVGFVARATQKAEEATKTAKTAKEIEAAAELHEAASFAHDELAEDLEKDNDARAEKHRKIAKEHYRQFQKMYAEAQELAKKEPKRPDEGAAPSVPVPKTPKTPPAAPEATSIPEPSKPKITAKVLKAQKNDLLAQLDQAIAEAPEEGTEKITLAVEGDGVFTVFNTKENLKSFRALAKKSFPENVASGERAKGPSKPKAIPKVEDPIQEDQGDTIKHLGKIAGEFVSQDPARFAITVSYADGTQIVSTDGRQMLRIVTDQAPGHPQDPVRLDEEGKIVDASDYGNYPNYKGVRDPNKEFLVSGIDTAELAHLARQGEVFRDTSVDRDKQGSVPLKLWRNPDGSLGGEMSIVGEKFTHNIQKGAVWLGDYNPDYLWNIATVARKLGSERLDAYAHSGDSGPIEFQGKIHSNLLQGIRLSEGMGPMRARASEFSKFQTRPEHVKLPEGYGPLEDPDIARSLNSDNKTRVTLEKGRINIEERDPKTGNVTGKIGSLQRGDWPKGAKAQRSVLTEVTGLSGKTVSIDPLRETIEKLIKERDQVAEEAQKRVGEARPITEEGGMHSGIALGITPQPPEWLANIARIAGQKLEAARNQLPARLKSRDVRHRMDQTIDAADNMARVVGDQLGRRIRVGGVSELLDSAASAVIAAKYDPTNLPALLAMARRGRNEKAIAAINYALAHWDQAERIAERGKAVFDWQINQENRKGIETLYKENYLPGVYDKDLWMGHGRPYMISGGGGLSTAFKKGKTYDSPFHAIADGYKPTSLRLSDMVQHRVTEGQRLLNRKSWGDALRNFRDPTDGKAVVESMIKVQRGPGLPGYEHPPVGYVPREVIPGQRIAVHEDYAKLFDALLAVSRVHGFEPVGLPVGSAALELEGFLKHSFLLFDTFHLARVAQKQASIMGLSAPFRRRMGLTLLEYTNRDLADAVRSGEITAEMADYARTNRSKFQLAMRTGLNVGRIQENMYNSVWKNIPGFGHFNKFVMERYTRGAMVESWLHAFDKIRADNPHISEREAAFKTSRDINQIFGNLGRQGVFKDPTFLDMARLVALAPVWVEALARTEIRGAKQLTWDPLMKKEIPFIQARGVLGRSFRNGLVSYFIGTQLLNLATRGQFTWQNKEKGHKLDAWIPGGQNGFFISPLTVFAELTHDLLRYSRTEPDIASALVRIGRNKLSPLGRAADVLATGRDWDNEKVIGSWERVKHSAAALAPVPITFSGVSRQITGTPRYPGETQRQLLSSLTGIKSEPAQTSAMRVSDMAKEWLSNGPPKLRARYERELKQEFGPSDYKGLRAALLRKDFPQAREQLNKLLETKSTKDIYQAMRPVNKDGLPKPFTGARDTEKYFLQSLTPDEKNVYREAVRERIELWNTLKQMMQEK